LFIQVDGYTDNTGSEGVNQALSDARAAAVKDWLQKHAPRNFPDNRFKIAGTVRKTRWRPTRRRRQGRKPPRGNHTARQLTHRPNGEDPDDLPYLHRKTEF